MRPSEIIPRDEQGFRRRVTGSACGKFRQNGSRKRRLRIGDLSRLTHSPHYSPEHHGYQRSYVAKSVKSDYIAPTSSHTGDQRRKRPWRYLTEPGIKNPEDINEEQSKRIFWVVQTVFSLLLARSLVEYKACILDPFSSQHYLTSLGLVLVYLTALWSWIDYSYSTIVAPYDFGHGRFERLRFVRRLVDCNGVRLPLVFT